MHPSPSDRHPTPALASCRNKLPLFPSRRVRILDAPPLQLIVVFRTKLDARHAISQGLKVASFLHPTQEPQEQEL